MKKWKIALPLMLTAAGAAAALVLSRKATKGETAPKKDVKTAPEPGNQTEGKYSFISGFKDPTTVELSIPYAPDKFSFSVISEEFLSYSSDSHVAVLWGEDYHIQIEYASYYQGEGFEALARAAAEKYKGFARTQYGEHEALRYLDGDSICICLRIPGDEISYVLLTVIRAAADPDEFTALPDDPAFAAMLSGIRFSIHR